MKAILSFIVLTLSFFQCWAAYEDARCKCVCLNRTISVNATKPVRKIYVKAIAAEKCTCPLMLKQEATTLCPYCDCTYQVRNTTTIKVVVCLILVVISALTLYMLFLLLLEPLLSARRSRHKFPATSSFGDTNTPTSTSGLGPGDRGSTIKTKPSFSGSADGTSVTWSRQSSDDDPPDPVVQFVDSDSSDTSAFRLRELRAKHKRSFDISRNLIS